MPYREYQGDPSRPALVGPTGLSITFAEIDRLRVSIQADLSAFGVIRSTRIAISIASGFELGQALLAILDYAVCAPLNPRLPQPGAHNYLNSIAADVLLTCDGESAAACAAAALGIPVIRISSGARDEKSYNLELHGTQPLVAFESGPTEIALLLATSGTTAQGKLVGLTGKNLRVSAANVSRSLALSECDRCLNMMPLFHIHGLIAGLLAPLQAGGSTVCDDAGGAARFVEQASCTNPTWYTAVPAIHQSVVDQVLRAPLERRGLPRFRFIRSSSAPLSKPLRHRLEETFEAPVVEAYGLTEASHQVAHTGLENRAPAGSVGRPYGVALRVVDDSGHSPPSGVQGEIVIRGRSVIPAYERPKENPDSHIGGWLRTGDVGYVDEDGWLYLTGRVKEVINRGGFQVSPAEVDAQLGLHPAVNDVAAFGVSHPTLGEDLVAAVVPASTEGSVNASALRAWATARLPDYKVPSQILLVSALPRSATGKIRRNKLAEHYSQRLSAELVAPRNDLEEAILNIWAEALGGRGFGIHNNFFRLGGDSLRAAMVINRLTDLLGFTIPLESIFENPTTAELAEALENIVVRQIHAAKEGLQH